MKDNIYYRSPMASQVPPIDTLHSLDFGGVTIYTERQLCGCVEIALKSCETSLNSTFEVLRRRLQWFSNVKVVWRSHGGNHVIVVYTTPPPPPLPAPTTVPTMHQLHTPLRAQPSSSQPARTFVQTPARPHTLS